MAKILLEPFQNVVATGQAQLTTQRIWPNTLEYIMLVLGGTTFTKAMITNLQVRLGQKTIWYTTGTDVQTLNSYEGRTASANYLSLNFANAFARTPKQQYLGAIDFGQVGVRDLTNASPPLYGSGYGFVAGLYEPYQRFGYVSLGTSF